MSVLEKIKKVFISLGALFAALFLSLSVLSTPVLAVPNTTQTDNTNTAQNQDQEDDDDDSGNTCYDESGSLGWLVCPATGFLARITDGLYGIIEQNLVVKPLTSSSDSPYHQIWSIFRDFTNIVFVIFFCIVIYSQVTGIGISNYGIKKLLPKIILSAILINLSYIICAALVDVSNIAGSSLRNIFSDIEQSITPTGIIVNMPEGTTIDLGNIVAGLIGGALIAPLAVGAAGGLGMLFFSLIPVLLGAIVAVLIAFLTIALRQAYVYVLIMISPLAFVCMLLPNTERWFTQWKRALSQMLLFYPMFAVLFGACSLVGWTIIAAAEDGFALVLGIAIKIVPLVTSWSLLKMSGTLPGQISAAVDKLAGQPLVNATRNASATAAALQRAKYLGTEAKTWQYGRRFAQHRQDVNARRLADTQKYLEMSKARGSAYAANIHTKDGNISRRGRQLAALAGQTAEYQRQILKNANDAEKGIANYARNDKDREQLKRIDIANMNAADALYYETSRGEKVRFDNIQSRHERIDSAISANSNATFNATKRASEAARFVNQNDLARYRQINNVLEGDILGTHLVGANASSDYATQTAILGKKFGAYFNSIPATQELYDRLFQLTSSDHDITKDIDPILAGMRALNMRGDTDLVTNVLRRIVESNQIQLGTHASQSISNFCMFDVKDSDALVRRYGKYINLETARVFNEGQSKPKRKNTTLSFKEYITGEYDEYDDNGNLIPNYGKSKLSVAPLLMGTSLDGSERTAFANIDQNLRVVYADANGNLSPEAAKAMAKKRTDINNAMLPAIINAALKYPSGSEQGINLASYITGLKLNSDGTYSKRWEDKTDPLFGLPEDYFADFTKLYLSAQVPSQITSLRTDTFMPIIQTLASDYISKLNAHKAKPDKEPDPAADLPESATPPPSDVPDWYYQKPEEILETDSEAEKKRKKDANEALAKKQEKLRNEYAKANFIAILHKAKTLGPIIRSLSSGSVNSAKRVVRDFLGVSEDDPFALAYNEENRENRFKKLRELREKIKKKKEQKAEEEENAPTEPASEQGPAEDSYDQELRQLLQEEFSEWAENMTDEDTFVSRIIENLRTNGLGFEAQSFKEYAERHPDATIEDLLAVILFILDGKDV